MHHTAEAALLVSVFGFVVSVVVFVILAWRDYRLSRRMRESGRISIRVNGETITIDLEHPDLEEVAKIERATEAFKASRTEHDERRRKGLIAA